VTQKESSRQSGFARRNRGIMQPCGKALKKALTEVDCRRFRCAKDNCLSALFGQAPSKGAFRKIQRAEGAFE